MARPTIFLVSTTCESSMVFHTISASHAPSSCCSAHKFASPRFKCRFSPGMSILGRDFWISVITGSPSCGLPRRRCARNRRLAGDLPLRHEPLVLLADRVLDRGGLKAELFFGLRG